jgi:hypothetical protein
MEQISEMNCTEIITFIDDSSVDVLIGGGTLCIDRISVD